MSDTINMNLPFRNCKNSGKTLEKPCSQVYPDFCTFRNFFLQTELKTITKTSTTFREYEEEETEGHS